MKKLLRKIVPLELRKIIHAVRSMPELRKEIAELKSDLLYYKVLHYHEYNPSTEYESEISYLKQHGTITPFPYRQLKPLATVETGFDDKKQLPYVMHAEKKLFFPAAWSAEGAKHMYTNYITTENILGGGYSEKAPHQYLTENFVVKQNDIVIDVGAAEGLFLLDVIDRVKKAYIFEPDPGWLTTLKATFEPYMHKVTIIEKYATNRNSATEATLDSCIEDDADSIFIKMDVEGMSSMYWAELRNYLHKNKIYGLPAVLIIEMMMHKHLKNSLKNKGFKPSSPMDICYFRTMTRSNRLISEKESSGHTKQNSKHGNDGFES